MGGLISYDRRVDVSGQGYDNYNTRDASLDDFQSLTCQRTQNKGTLALNGSGGLKCVGHRFWNWGSRHVSSESAQALRGALMSAVRNEIEKCFDDLKMIVSTCHAMPGEMEKRLQTLDAQKAEVLKAFEKQIERGSGKELKRSDIQNIVLNAKALKWNITYERVANLQADALASLHTDGAARTRAEQYANPDKALNEELLKAAVLTKNFRDVQDKKTKVTEFIDNISSMLSGTKVTADVVLNAFKNTVTAKLFPEQAVMQRKSAHLREMYYQENGNFFEMYTKLEQEIKDVDRLWELGCPPNSLRFKEGVATAAVAGNDAKKRYTLLVGALRQGSYDQIKAFNDEIKSRYPAIVISKDETEKPSVAAILDGLKKVVLDHLEGEFPHGKFRAAKPEVDVMAMLNEFANAIIGGKNPVGEGSPKEGLEKQGVSANKERETVQDAAKVQATGEGGGVEIEMVKLDGNGKIKE